MATLLQRLIRRGGIKLKLIGLFIFTILVTVGCCSYFNAKLVEEVATAKSFAVAEISLERIASTAAISLLERTYENRVNLEEILHEIRASKSDGVLDISIYATVKTDDGLSFVPVAGFAPPESMDPLPPAGGLSGRIQAAKDDTVFCETFTYRVGESRVPAYRFVKPIFFEYEQKTNLLGAAVLVYSREAVEAAVNQMIVVSLLITVGVLPVGIVISYLLGARLVKPIITVASAASEVTRGNLDVHLDIGTNDEIEVLAQRFNAMVQGLKEREMMQKFVSGSTIEMIKQGNVSNVTLGGEHTSLTIFFSDIRGFTALSEAKEADEVVAIVNHYFDLQAKIIHQWGGDIDKFVGDSVMAVFGGNEGVDRALRAAIEIQQAIERNNRERSGRGLTTVQIGIGICHGKVVAGNIGSSDRMNFTCMGPAVNLASRLCAMARHFEILINRRTFQLAQERYMIEEIGPLVQKGFAQPINVLLVKAVMPEGRHSASG